jgi:trehalose 6-phosphate phosphatase
MAWSRVLLAFDFDGTLAPIVDDRSAAEMRKRTATLLAEACTLYPCAVISGRSQKDVAARLQGAAVEHVVGNHGLEPGTELTSFAEKTACAAPLLRRALAPLTGVEIEDKRYSLAVHFRRVRHKGAARSAIEEAVAALPLRMRIIPGKQVVNVVPDGAPNKGDALIQLRTLAKADTALYVGDDITDEDVFQIDQPGRLLTVRIGASRSSAAAYFLRDQKEIDDVLAELSRLRKAGRGGR